MPVPVCQGAVGLDRCDDADREAPLTHGRADERGDGARGNPREVAKQGVPIFGVNSPVVAGERRAVISVMTGKDARSFTMARGVPPEKPGPNWHGASRWVP